jgi:hypothetical protein
MLNVSRIKVLSTLMAMSLMSACQLADPNAQITQGPGYVDPNKKDKDLTGDPLVVETSVSAENATEVALTCLGQAQRAVCQIDLGSAPLLEAVLDIKFTLADGEVLQQLMTLSFSGSEARLSSISIEGSSLGTVRAISIDVTSVTLKPEDIEVEEPSVVAKVVVEEKLVVEEEVAALEKAAVVYEVSEEASAKIEVGDLTKKIVIDVKDAEPIEDAEAVEDAESVEAISAIFAPVLIDVKGFKEAIKDVGSEDVGDSVEESAELVSGDPEVATKSDKKLEAEEPVVIEPSYLEESLQDFSISFNEKDPDLLDWSTDNKAYLDKGVEIRVYYAYDQEPDLNSNDYFVISASDVQGQESVQQVMASGKGSTFVCRAVIIVDGETVTHLIGDAIKR